MTYEYGFETAVVSSEAIGELLVFQTAVFAVSALILPRILVDKHRCPRRFLVPQVAPVIFTIQKIAANFYCVIWAFFRNFNTGDWVLRLPSTMSFSTFLVGLLGIIGTIDGLASAPSVLKNSQKFTSCRNCKHNRTCPNNRDASNR